MPKKTPKQYFLMDAVTNEITVVLTSDDVIQNTDKFQYVMKCLTTMPNCFSLLELSSDFKAD